MADDGFTPRSPEAIGAQLRQAHTRRALAISNRDRARANMAIAMNNACVHQDTVDAENHCIDSLLDAWSKVMDEARLEQMVQG